MNCLSGCRRLSALAAAAQAVQSAVTAINTLSCGGDDQHCGPAQSALLQGAVATVPGKGSSAMQAIEAIEAALTYSQASVQVWSSTPNAQHNKPCADRILKTCEVVVYNSKCTAGVSFDMLLGTYDDVCHVPKCTASICARLQVLMHNPKFACTSPAAQQVALQSQCTMSSCVSIS